MDDEVHEVEAYSAAPLGELELFQPERRRNVEGGEHCLLDYVEPKDEFLSRFSFLNFVLFLHPYS